MKPFVIAPTFPREDDRRRANADSKTGERARLGPMHLIPRLAAHRRTHHPPGQSMSVRTLVLAVVSIALAGCTAVSTVPPDPATSTDVAAAVYDTVAPSTGVMTLAGPSIGRAKLSNGVFELRYTISPDRRDCAGPFVHVTVFRPIGSEPMAVHPISAISGDGTALVVVQTETINSGDGVFETTIVLLPPGFLERTRRTGTAIELHGLKPFACSVPAYYIDGFMTGAARIFREQRLSCAAP